MRKGVLRMHNNRFLKFAAFTLVMIMSLSMFAANVYASNEEDVWVKVFYGGREHTLVNKAFVSDEELYLPLREVMNLCGVSDDDISYDNGRINVLFKNNPDIWVDAEMYVNQNGVAFDKDLKYDIIGINGKRTTTHPVLLKDDTAYIPVGMLIRIKNYYVSQNYDRRVYLYPLGDLEVWQYAFRGEYFKSGRYDVVLSAPIDVTQDDRYDSRSYFDRNEDVFIGRIKDFENREFPHTEVNGYYYPTEAHKWILLDENNKVVAVIPYENFRHESVDPSTFGTTGWETAKYYIDDVRSDNVIHPNAVPYGRGGLNVCQNIPRVSQDGKEYYYSLPYCFVDFRYLVK